MIDLSPDAWAAVGIAIATTGSTITAVWIAHIKTARQATSIAEHVEDVRKLAAPTGNGYADETRAALARIERKQDALGRDLLQHLQDHSRSDLDRHHHREEP